jgi:alpha-amylase/alpha-mannosidase (GH57 family)
MHQPLYKDLVTGEFRMPWVRMHALKDYYGMVRLLDEFPTVHQNFNLVPSLVSQIEEYATGTFHDPFYDVVARQASDLSPEDRRFALQYLFQAHPERMIARYPRYQALYGKLRAASHGRAQAESLFNDAEITDLQVLSQLAWFDEFYLEREAEIRALVDKGSGYTQEDQRTVLRWEHQILNAVLPTYTNAAFKGYAELSATPYYHPILPLLCDSGQGAVSSPGLPLPKARFHHPEDAAEQIRRAIEKHAEVFGVRPRGMWPSEGSVSEEVLKLAAEQGLDWLASDEGVLGRSAKIQFERDGNGVLGAGPAENLYRIYRYEEASRPIHLVFRDHRLSDLIGFVYAGMPAADAAAHLTASLKSQAAPLLSQGKDAVVSIILDGENAWESFDHNGREFLRRFYDHLTKDPQIEAVTISEAIQRTKPEEFGKLKHLVPGSWINANFNIWIGAPEDNRSWEYLGEARDYYTAHADAATPQARKLAYEELMIAEGSDWNWWYGPEHHSANDADFDELYRRHLSNVYQALGGVPPDTLSRPIQGGIAAKATLVPQTAFIQPNINGHANGYFEWLGALLYKSDRRTGSMHGKQFVFDALYAGVNSEHLYVRLDLATSLLEGPLQLVVQVAVSNGETPRRSFRLNAEIVNGAVENWQLWQDKKDEPLATDESDAGVAVTLVKICALRIPLVLIDAPHCSVLNLRAVLYHSTLPIDAMPVEGSLELPVLSEEEMIERSYD